MFRRTREPHYRFTIQEVADMISIAADFDGTWGDPEVDAIVAKCKGIYNDVGAGTFGISVRRS